MVAAAGKDIVTLAEPPGKIYAVVFKLITSLKLCVF